MNTRMSLGTIGRSVGIVGTIWMTFDQDMQQALNIRAAVVVLLGALQLWCYHNSTHSFKLGIAFEMAGTAVMAFSLGLVIALKAILDMPQVGILIGGILGFVFLGGVSLCGIALVRNCLMEIRQSTIDRRETISVEKRK